MGRVAFPPQERCPPCHLQHLGLRRDLDFWFVRDRRSPNPGQHNERIPSLSNNGFRDPQTATGMVYEFFLGAETTMRIAATQSPILVARCIPSVRRHASLGNSGIDHVFDLLKDDHDQQVALTVGVAI